MWNIKEIHNIDRPGEPPVPGDLVEVECVGGFVKAVDPVTRQATDRHQRFRLGEQGTLTPVHTRLSNKGG